jgi:amino acid adenylation domain-containing protein
VNRQPVPIGVAGEIYIGGAGVAKGYLNRPDLTEEKFLPDPFRLEPESRMYRTGDMGRWLPDGKIEFLGRNDFQIKIRGFRVELGEIEAALTRHSQVREAVIIARENQETGKQLVAYYTGEEIGAEALRLYLSAMLPDYMAPVAYVHLESLPLTQNGKLDRRALPAPEGQAFISRGYEAPLNETESRIAQIWAALLSLDRVGRLDNFFDLGGHSLLATQVISRVREVFKLELPLRVLFEAPTLAELAAQVDRANQAAQGVSLPPIIPIASGSPLPLSFAQQRLWYIDQLHPGSSLYNCPIAVELSGDLDIQALERTLTEIIRRHEVLRTSFPIIDGNPIQHISEAEPVSLPVLDLTELNESARDSEARRLIVEEATRPFCLARGPLLRTSLIRLDKQKHIARLTMHHITSDAWSLSVLMREVATLYEAYSKGLPSPLSELSIQYADFAAWQRKRLQGEVLERELNYWKEQLKNVAVIELPTDHARPPSPSYRGGRERVELGREVCEGLRRLSQREGVTMFMALMAAFKALLMKYSGQEDLSIGTSIANRTRKEVEELIGFFVNTLVMRTNLGGNPSFRELTEREREVALGAYGHQEIPFEKLVEEINPKRDLSRNPLFQVMMELQNTRREEYELRDLKLSGMGEELVMAKFDLRLMLTEEREGLSGSLEYSRDLYEGETISRMARHYERVVKEVVRDADQRIRWIELLSETEKRQIIEEWNETERAYGGARLVHEMIAEQAERSGDAIAVRSEQGELSYQKLNRLGNQLGNYLQGLGVGPEVVVGMYLERSMEMVVALLGVLKAGGCYLPLDPEYPLERLGYLLEDAGAGIVLTQRGIEAGLPAFMGQIVCLDEEWERIKEQSESAPESEVEAENLAYVIYTSGSSGRPKGVMINHGGVVNYLRWATETYGIGEGEGAPVNSSIGFDLTVTSLYGPLVNGKSVKLLSEEEGIEALARDLSQERGYSLVKITPAHLDLLTEQLRNTEVEGRTRVLVIGGEELKAGGLKNWQERAKATRLINEYGPTETVVGCCVYEVEGKECEREATPIGRPISNAQIYILNGELEPAPIGVRGEIYISGAGVGRGYLGKPELTAERFIPHRFSRSGGERVYRTGDVGRYRADGNIEFLGRIDHQVKIRGFRIELGEIEAALNRHPAVREAVVVARQDQDSGKRLVAYYTGEEIGAEALRLHLSATLPDYMAPAAYVHLESLPLTQNGKLDRLALPAPEGQAYTTGGYEPPVNETEAKLAQIWADLLKLERVGRFDNFFDLGGHSLLLVELQNRLQSAFERDVLIAEMFRYPTVSSLARYITKGRNETGRSRAVTERAKRRREALDRRSSRFSPAE